MSINRQQRLLRLQNDCRERQRLLRENEVKALSTQINDPVKLGEQPCLCGRRLSKTHCPRCGSYDIYTLAKKSNVKTDPNTGQQHKLPVIRCKRCGQYFDTMDRCYAVPYVTSAQIRDKAALINVSTSREKAKPVHASALVSESLQLSIINAVKEKRGEPALTSTEFKQMQTKQQTQPKLVINKVVDCDDCRCRGQEGCICLCHGE